MSDILVIIPAFNEEANIEQVVENLIIHHSELDYVIVNDGSTDATAKICRDKNYNMIDLPINLGLAGAFQTGMRYAYQKNYRYAVQFDGDGQHRPEYILPMKEKMDEGYDIVIASRFAKEKKRLSPRMFGSRVIAMAIFLTTGKRIKDPTSGMRMYNRKLIEKFALKLNYGPEPDTVSYLVKQGAHVAEVQCHMQERMGGISYLTPWNAGKYMLRMLTSILFIQNFRSRK